MSRSGTLAAARWILVLSVVDWHLHVGLRLLLAQMSLLSGK